MPKFNVIIIYIDDMRSYFYRLITSVGRKLSLTLTKHELAVLRISMKHPLLGMYVGFSLDLVWIFLPAILVFLPLSVAFGVERAMLLLSIPAAVALIAAAPWFFGWYFTLSALMFGRRRMAEAKLEKLTKRLARLQLDPA